VQIDRKKSFFFNLKQFKINFGIDAIRSPTTMPRKGVFPMEAPMVVWARGEALSGVNLT
jgi:hypothetical protein